jgi:hypothetical protein
LNIVTSLRDHAEAKGFGFLATGIRGREGESKDLLFGAILTPGSLTLIVRLSI